MIKKHEKLKYEKIKLCEERVAFAKKTNPNHGQQKMWKLHLKRNKSRDPHGYANELFKPEVAGRDLKEAI